MWNDHHERNILARSPRRNVCEKRPLRETWKSIITNRLSALSSSYRSDRAVKSNRGPRTLRPWKQFGKRTKFRIVSPPISEIRRDIVKFPYFRDISSKSGPVERRTGEEEKFRAILPWKLSNRRKVSVKKVIRIISNNRKQLQSPFFAGWIR